MQILINLKIKWGANGSIITPIVPPVAVNPIPEVPITPPTSDVIDITKTWYDTFGKGYGTLILESGKTYTLNTVKKLEITGDVRIGTTGTDPAYLWVGKKLYILYINSGEDSVLFLLMDGANVVIDNVWPSLREQDRNVQQMYSVNWFNSVQDSNAKWTAIVKNCDSTFLGKNGGFGTGLLYGGIHENYVSLINCKHAGPMLMELKNPWENGVMYVVMENVSTDYTDPKAWAKREHLTTGKITLDNILNLTGDVEASCLYNHFFNVDTGSNRSTIAHIGRFTFMIDSIGAVIDMKNIQLRASPKAGEKVFVKRGRFFFKGREPHCSDTFVIQGKSYTIVEKNKTENDEWTNNFGSGTSPQTIKAPQCMVSEVVDLVDGEYVLESYNSSFNLYNQDQPVYLIYKDDFGFRTRPTTTFGFWEVLNARGASHIAYNHRNISIWAKDVELQGYYRESTQGLGKSLGYNLVNCIGFDDEFSDKEITTDKQMPERVKFLL